MDKINKDFGEMEHLTEGLKAAEQQIKKRKNMSSKFFTNNDDRNLFDKFKGIIEHMKDLYAFHAVVGYFRSAGYFALQPHLENIKDIKILVGINVDQMFAEAQRKAAGGRYI